MTINSYIRYHLKSAKFLSKNISCVRFQITYKYGTLSCIFYFDNNRYGTCLLHVWYHQTYLFKWKVKITKRRTFLLELKEEDISNIVNKKEKIEKILKDKKRIIKFLKKNFIKKAFILEYGV